MKRRTAAAYLDLSLADFDREVASLRLPRGFMLGRSLHWSRATIDEYLDRLSGGVVPDWRERSPLYNPNLRSAKDRSGRPVTTEEALAYLLKAAGGKTGPKTARRKPQGIVIKASYLGRGAIVAAMIGRAIATDEPEIAVNVSADGGHVEVAASPARQTLDAAEALRVADELAHAAREALINDTEDVVDHDTRWV